MGSRVLILRHAETSQPYIFHGAESDVGLSNRGLRQAEAVAPIIAAEQPVAVVSSAMRRAVQTARPIALACCVPIIEESELHERRVGAMSGTSTSGDNSIWAATLARWKAGDLGFAPEGAESFIDIQNRVLPVWDHLASQFSGETWVLVVHGLVIRALLIGLIPEFQPFGWHMIGISHVAINELCLNENRWVVARLHDRVIPEELVDSV